MTKSAEVPVREERPEEELAALKQAVLEVQRSLQSFQSEASGARQDNLRLQQRVRQLEKENRYLRADVNEYESQMSWAHLDILEEHYRAIAEPRGDRDVAPFRQRLPSLRGRQDASLGLQVSICTPTLTPANSVKSLLPSGSAGRLPGLSPMAAQVHTRPLTMADAVQDLSSRPAATSFEWPQQ